jgi:serine/threonine-protein kinase
VTAAPVVPSGVPSAVANIRLPPSSVDIAPAPLPTPAAPARARAAAAPGRRPRSQPPAEATTPAPAAEPEDEPLPTLPKSRAPLVIGVVAVLAVVGGGAWLALGQSAATSVPSRPGPTPDVTPPASTPTTPTTTPTTVATPPPTGTKPPAERARLSITSVPAGAEVYESDVLLGTTPLTLQRPIDSVAELRFELTGFQKVTRKVGFSADTTVNVALEASKRTPPATPTTTPPRPPAGQGELKDAPF